MSLAAFDSFLKERLRSCDALLIDRSIVDGQEVQSEVRKIYSSNHEGPVKYTAGAISFVGTPGSWGNPTLQSNDKALVFVSYLKNSQRYYQHHWLAHFIVKELDGQEYALATWNINNKNWWPDVFHSQCVVPDASKPWQVAIPYALFEEHLARVIAGGMTHVDG